MTGGFASSFSAQHLSFNSVVICHVQTSPGREGGGVARNYRKTIVVEDTF